MCRALCQGLFQVHEAAVFVPLGFFSLPNFRLSAYSIPVDYFLCASALCGQTRETHHHITSMLTEAVTRGKLVCAVKSTSLIV